MSDDYRSFREFYPFYLSEHRDRTCRRLHVVGSALVLACLALALFTLNAWWLLGAVLRRLRLRLGRTLLFRAQPARDFRSSDLQSDRRLGDVPRRGDRQDSLLANGASPPAALTYTHLGYIIE